MRLGACSELSDTIFERTAAAIVLQELLSVSLFFRPVGHQEEVMRKELQLAGLWIWLVNDHEHESLLMLPGFCLVHAKLYDGFVTFAGWPPNGSL